MATMRVPAEADRDEATGRGQPLIGREPMQVAGLDEQEVLRVDPDEWAHALHAASALAGDLDCLSATELAEAGAALVGSLPLPLIRAVQRFAAQGSGHNGLLLRGLLPSPGLPPSPGTARPDALDRPVQTAAVALLGIMTLFGAPFTFASLYGGRLVQHVTPARGQERAQASEGSGTFLDWHVEDAFSPERCDLFGLYCLRGDPAAITLFAPVRRARLDARLEQVLRQERFAVRPDIAHGQDGTGGGAPIAVLSGPGDDPEICHDAVYLAPKDPDDRLADQALTHLGQALTAAAVGHVAEPGDLLVLDNRRVVHARTAFRPRYDGTDRWLLRVMVCACGRAHRRRVGQRVI